MAAVRVVAWSASVSAVGAAVQLLWRRWKRFRSRKQYDGLDGKIGRSWLVNLRLDVVAL